MKVRILFLLSFFVSIFILSCVVEEKEKEKEDTETRASIIGIWNTVNAKGMPYDKDWGQESLDYTHFEFQHNDSGIALMNNPKITSLGDMFGYTTTVKSITISNWKWPDYPLIENGTYRLVVDADTMKWFKDDVSTTDRNRFKYHILNI